MIKPANIIQILDSSGLDDSFQLLGEVDGHDREMRLFAVWCARKVDHLVFDQRSKDAIDIAERFANGKATKQELTAAWVSARPSAWKTWDTGVAFDAACGDTAWAYVTASSRDVAIRSVQEKELRRVCAEIEEQETMKVKDENINTRH